MNSLFQALIVGTGLIVLLGYTLGTSRPGGRHAHTLNFLSRFEFNKNGLAGFIIGLAAGYDALTFVLKHSPSTAAAFLMGVASGIDRTLLISDVLAVIGSVGLFLDLLAGGDCGQLSLTIRLSLVGSLLTVFLLGSLIARRFPGRLIGGTYFLAWRRSNITPACMALFAVLDFTRFLTSPLGVDLVADGNLARYIAALGVAGIAGWLTGIAPDLVTSLLALGVTYIQLVLPAATCAGTLEAGASSYAIVFTLAFVAVAFVRKVVKR